MSIVNIFPVRTEVSGQFSAPPSFQVVAISKFLIMLFFTMGLYGFYWYYRNWQLSRGEKGFSWVPLVLCILGPFTIYFLLKRLSRRAAETAPTFSVSPVRITLMYWAPILMFVATCALVSQFAAGVVSWPALTLLTVMWLTLVSLVPLMLVALVCAQQAINVVEGDAAGQRNIKITWANGVWMAIGTLFLYVWGSVHAFALMMAQAMQ